MSSDDAIDGSPERFYDDFAGDYHLIFADWWEGARRQGEVIGGLLRREGVEPPAGVLDCSCGIGTQALGLARLGYRVHGTDVSASAVERARLEAAARGVSADFMVADMREVDAVVGAAGGVAFDAVLSFDNSLPHLLTDHDLDAALRAVRRCLPEGGVFLGSVRDYDALRAHRPTGDPPRLLEGRDGRRIVGQAWEWSEDGEHVKIHLFVLRDEGGAWRVTVRPVLYRALTAAALTGALRRTGFDAVHWLDPGVSGYYQPVVTARAVA